jgi:GTPase SAR1 family protein
MSISLSRNDAIGSVCCKLVGKENTIVLSTASESEEKTFFKMSKVDVKIVLLGMHDVGKTCLVERYLHGKFKYNVTATVGAAFGAKKVEVNGKGFTLGIWV